MIRRSVPPHQLVWLGGRVSGYRVLCTCDRRGHQLNSLPPPSSVAPPGEWDGLRRHRSRCRVQPWASCLLTKFRLTSSLWKKCASTGKNTFPAWECVQSHGKKTALRGLERQIAEMAGVGPGNGVNHAFPPTLTRAARASLRHSGTRTTGNWPFVVGSSDLMNKRVACIPRSTGIYNVYIHRWATAL